MDFIISEFTSLSEYKEIEKSVKEKIAVGVSGLSGVNKAVLIAALCKKLGQNALLITPTEGEATSLAEELSRLDINALLFPERDYSPLNSLSRSHEFEQKRIATLSKISDRDFDVVVASAVAAVSRTVSAEELRENSFTLKTGEEYSLRKITEKLSSMGYTKFDEVDGVGQFSVRGGILDIFTPSESQPVRIDFWGDEIDSIYLFDNESKRRTQKITQVSVLPAYESLPQSRKQLIEKLKKLATSKNISELAKQNIYNDIDALSAGLTVPYDRYPEQIHSGFSTLIDHIGGMVFVSETNGINSRFKNLYETQKQELELFTEKGVCFSKKDPYYLKRTQFLKLINEKYPIYLENFPKSKYPTDISENITFSFKVIPPFSTVKELSEELKNERNRNVVILAGEERAAQNLANELTELGINAEFAERKNLISANGIIVTDGSLSGGFSSQSAGFSVYSYAHAAPRKRRRYFKKGVDIGSLDDLKIGDYVVHTTHGIGRFAGVQTLTVKGVTKDYIKISYMGSDALYVPVTSLDLVSKYIGSAEENIKLNRLGTHEWEKTKQRVRKSVKDIAKQLTLLYAKRMQQKGYAFSADGELQADFEKKFMYDETEDQLRCSDEIKRDMESLIPMDRLLCGDVGFGKTEVALRAAFKCICDGKQCAILVPTTILAWQHYKTAVERFSGLPVEIEMLSRFRTVRQQGDIKKKLKNGTIDLIIGTHRMIGGDIEFHDLGLLIVDEEQRFGVSQKEKLKERYPTVDVLTLSATPIPRTLNMALSGLRDMSSIEEPPLDRLPVQTYVTEQNEGIVAEAIERELRRAGQVFYLHNRVESIVTRAAEIARLVPDARVGIAHGKMDESELSEVWRRMIEQEIDVLVCTTIIETGVDVPNANTLIIEDADRMGLSQLHQLRGRVGRSHRKAQAYFMYRTGKTLSEISRKRLEAIRDFTEFGSGFKIALIDLEIRGAGNILGGEQHGHMESVGYDMYLKMLNDALKEEQDGKAESGDKTDCTVELQCNSHIPENYIRSLPQRLSIYRKIAAVTDETSKLDVVDELIDRFGEPPQTVLKLIDIALLRYKAGTLGITTVSESLGRVNFIFKEPDPERILGLVKALPKRVAVSSSEAKISVKPAQNQTILSAAFEVIEKLTDTDMHS